MMKEITWKIKPFPQLSAGEVYEMLKIRQEVFIVEQTCYYLDADGYDQKAVHVWGEKDGEIVAYCRIFGCGIKYPEASLERVLTHPNYRNYGLGKILLRIAIGSVEARFRTPSLRISAQDYLLKFYSEFGFQDTGKKYLEDDIPHTEMLKAL